MNESLTAELVSFCFIHDTLLISKRPVGNVLLTRQVHDERLFEISFLLCGDWDRFVSAADELEGSRS